MPEKYLAHHNCTIIVRYYYYYYYYYLSLHFALEQIVKPHVVSWVGRVEKENEEKHLALTEHQTYARHCAKR